MSTSPSTPVKSAFPKITPRVDPRLAHASAPQCIPPAPPKKGEQNQETSNGRAPTKTPLPPGPPVTIKVELWFEEIEDTDKHCPAFAYISARHDPQRIIAVLNKSLWPTAAALVRNDGNAIRWLVATAILDRCATWRSNPILAATQQHLVEIALGRWMGYQAIIWAAYALKDHEILAPIPQLLSHSKGPAKFAEFNVLVDSVRLADFDARLAKRFKRSRSVMPVK